MQVVRDTAASGSVHTPSLFVHFQMQMTCSSTKYPIITKVKKNQELKLVIYSLQMLLWQHLHLLTDPGNDHEHDLQPK